MNLFYQQGYTYIKPQHNWDNLVTGLRMDLQENMLLTQHKWQFNTNQNPEITETVRSSTHPAKSSAGPQNTP